MDTTTSIKMTTLAIQNLFSYVEEENLSALKVHLDRFKEVDGRSDVRFLFNRNFQTINKFKCSHRPSVFCFGLVFLLHVILKFFLNLI